MAKKYSLAGVLSCLFLILPSVSFAVEGYYALGKEKLEFRVVVVKAKEAGKDFKGMSDVKGKWFLVSPKVQLDSRDIEGVRVQKSKDRKDEYEIVIYFKKNSWNKVLGVTKQLIGKRLGIVRGDRLISAPVIQEPIDRQAQVARWLGIMEVKEFAAGFVLTDEPSADEREDEYIEWLEQRVRRSLGDLDALKKLAFQYFQGGVGGVKRDYGKAAELFRELLKRSPSEGEYAYFLAVSYVNLGQYDKAIETYERILVDRPDEEWNVRLGLGEVYKAMGETRDALKEYEKSLELIKAMPESEEYRDKMIEAVEKQIQQIKQSTKE